MRLTALQLKKIIREEVQAAALAEGVGADQLRVADPDTGKTTTIVVEEGPVPYTVRVSLGIAGGITLSLEDAGALGDLLKRYSAEY